GGIAGHAGLFATAGDVAAFGAAGLEGEPRLGIEPAVRGEALREQAADAADRRGLGWQLPRPLPDPERPPAADPDAGDPAEPAGLDRLGPGAFGHTGFTGTALSVDPDAGRVVACLTNRVWAGRATPGVGTLMARIHALAAEAAADPSAPPGPTR
ncbi:MAG: serine hydrolase, partial [Chloroflexota bacterium]